MKRILTDNASEKITVKWDRTAFALVRNGRVNGSLITIILNPREMLDLIEFVKEVINGKP